MSLIEYWTWLRATKDTKVPIDGKTYPATQRITLHVKESELPKFIRCLAQEGYSGFRIGDDD